MPADVAEAGGAQERVGHGVGDRVGVAVPVQPALGGDLHTAQYQLAPRGEAVRVVPVSDAHRIDGKSVADRSGDDLPESAGRFALADRIATELSAANTSPP